MPDKSFLIILDGWGLNPDPAVSAIEAADTPFMDGLMARYPHATLVTHGEDVGLPDGQMGNSEVGHLNIGAGRVVYQELARINKSIREHDLDQNPVLLDALARTTGTLHLIGLVSDGGVHSHIDHLLALGRIARAHCAGPIAVHAFTDGRDVDPKSGLGFIRRVIDAFKPLDIPVASVIGRYYAMDRDKRWERTRLAYDLLVNGQGTPSHDLAQSIEASYADGVTDEFIQPMFAADANGHPVALIRPGDTVLFFNFRTDRPRQITDVLTQRAFPDHGMAPLAVRMVTMTQYDATFRDVAVLFSEKENRGTLGEYLADLGKTQLRVAETEKYPHVTYFFSGGQETPFPGESRLLVPSPKVPTYDLQPEMSAPEVTEKTIAFIREHRPDFVCLNFANTDMVGHTGVFPAAVRAAETVDGCLANLVPFALEQGYAILIIADHGNSDVMVNPDGTPNTAHSKNPVPVIYVGQDAGHYTVSGGRLADVAPTLLAAMGLPPGPAMEGRVLLARKA
jgi:2,3-bisphosphoglycerate-independent phosphoglycerate mutase